MISFGYWYTDFTLWYLDTTFRIPWYHSPDTLTPANQHRESSRVCPTTFPNQGKQLKIFFSFFLIIQFFYLIVTFSTSSSQRHLFYLIVTTSFFLSHRHLFYLIVIFFTSSSFFLFHRHFSYLTVTFFISSSLFPSSPSGWPGWSEGPCRSGRSGWAR